MAKTYVISGGNSGIGLEAGKQLARDGHRVILLGRDAAKGEAAVAALKQAGGQADFIASDLSTHAGVKASAEKIAAANEKLDGLILGAGVLTTSGAMRTTDGLHAVFSVNYLSRYHLTQRLLPNLRAAGSATVVLIVAGVNVGTTIDFARYPKYDPWPGLAALGGVQISNYHYAKHLAAKEPSLKVGVTNVGLVKTEIMRAMPGFMRFMFNLTAPLTTIPVERAAANPSWLSTHSEWKTATYFPKPGNRDVTVDLNSALKPETEKVIELSAGLTGV
jgi:NAD(P)-dependent dehydrogenase (short-subunit alcohol dehydrogenase family)